MGSTTRTASALLFALRGDVELFFAKEDDAESFSLFGAYFDGMPTTRISASSALVDSFAENDTALFCEFIFKCGQQLFV